MKATPIFQMIVGFLTLVSGTFNVSALTVTSELQVSQRPANSSLSFNLPVLHESGYHLTDFQITFDGLGHQVVNVANGGDIFNGWAVETTFRGTISSFGKSDSSSLFQTVGGSFYDRRNLSPSQQNFISVDELFDLSPITLSYADVINSLAPLNSVGVLINGSFMNSAAFSQRGTFFLTSTYEGTIHVEQTFALDAISSVPEVGTPGACAFAALACCFIARKKMSS